MTPRPTAATRRHGWPRASCRVAARMMLAVPLALWLAVPALAQPKPAVRAEIDRIQSDTSYQLRFEPPPPQEPPPSPPPAWLRDFLDWLGGNGDWLVRGLSFLLIALAVLAVLYMTVPAVRDAIDAIRARFRRVRDPAQADDHWSPDATAARNLLSEADSLATQGRFAEAVHLLLGRSVEEIARRRPDALAPALTARAIARLGDLPVPARQAFARIGDVVERAIWARRVIARNDWDDARAAYQQFALGEHWRRTA